MLDSPQNLYVKNLQQSFGYPLRFPEPTPGLPVSYAENGLHIGDVGYVDEDGMFQVQFNICLPLDHDLHCARRKDLAGLVGLTQFNPSNAHPVPEGISAGRAICHGVEGPQGDNLKLTQSVPCKFKSNATSGALLILPSGAIRQNLDKHLEAEFRRFAEEHALEWCRITDCKSLYLITGLYKTRSWYLAAFHDVKPIGRVLLDRDEVGRNIWDSHCDYRQSSTENRSENQTVFISGFKIEKRGWDVHAQVVVQKLSLHPRSVWAELIWHIGFLLDILALFLWRIVSVSGLWGPDSTCKDVSAEVHINRVPAFTQPFHPSDVINRYLLDKNPNVQVAITHDSEWIGMIEQGELSHEDMMQEGRFLEFLEEKYTNAPNTDNVVYLQKKIIKPNSDDHCRLVLPRLFSFLGSSNDARQIVVTHMRLENIFAYLESIPIGFYILVQFGGTKRRTKIKPISLPDGIIEWEDEITLPTDLTTIVQLSVNASFEFEPMLGNVNTLYTLAINAHSLAKAGSTYLPFTSGEAENTPSCPSLLVTVGEQSFDPFAIWSRGHNHFGCDGPSCIKAAEETDKGQDALLRYHRGQGITDLEDCVRFFQLALDFCPLDHRPCYAVALFNFATARFLKSQVYGSVSDLNAAITSYHEVLSLRPGDHPDGPGTLLYLAQALLYRQGKLEHEEMILGEVERLANHVKEICSENSCSHRAADLVLQTLRRHNVLGAGSRGDLDQLISDLNWSARIPPEWYFDRPSRLINLGAALYRYFQVTGDLHRLEESISVMEEAAELIPDCHVDKPGVLASLGDALCARFIQRGHVADLDRSLSTIENALKLIQDGSFDRPRILASLGDALHVCFLRRGDVADLDNSITMIKAAMKCISDARRPRILHSLGSALRTRFVQRGHIADLENAISMIKDAVELTRDDHFDKPGMLASLCDALRVRVVPRVDIADLNHSISMIKDGLEVIPDGHLDKNRMLVSFGNALRMRFAQRTDLTDLDCSISMIKEAMKRTPDGHFDKPRILASLGSALRARWRPYCHSNDLDNSISAFDDAVKLAPDGYFDRCWMLASLGNVLHIRHMQRRDIVDRDRSIAMIEHAMRLGPDSIFVHPDLQYFEDVKYVRSANVI